MFFVIHDDACQVVASVLPDDLTLLVGQAFHHCFANQRRGCIESTEPKRKKPPSCPLSCFCPEQSPQGVGCIASSDRGFLQRLFVWSKRASNSRHFRSSGQLFTLFAFLSRPQLSDCLPRGQVLGVKNPACSFLVTVQKEDKNKKTRREGGRQGKKKQKEGGMEEGVLVTGKLGQRSKGCRPERGFGGPPWQGSRPHRCMKISAG